MRTDGLHCRESVGTGPVVLKVVPGTGAASSGGPISVTKCGCSDASGGLKVFEAENSWDHQAKVYLREAVHNTR